MYESQDYFDEKATEGTTLQRTFYFSNPTPVYKIKLDNIEGSSGAGMGNGLWFSGIVKRIC